MISHQGFPVAGRGGRVTSILLRLCGRGVGAYLAFFLLAVAAAPHRHLNDLEDLLLDQRSDSGILVEAVGTPDASAEPAFQPIRFVPDIPCPACFTRDFVSAPTPAFLYAADLGQPILLSCLPDVARPALSLADP